MKDWLELEADRVKLMNKHFTPGRGGNTIQYVVVHHNAGVLSIDQIWDVWQSRAASAHYQVQSDGTIGQLVNDWDTAWHAANAWMNQRSIGIEVSNSAGPSQDWPITDTAIREAGRLIAAVCLYYGLGRPESGKNVRYHREFTTTGCPYHLAPGGKYNRALMDEARRFYDHLKNRKNNPQPAPAPKENAPVTTAWKDGPAALNEVKHKVNDIEKILTLVADQLLGWPKDENGNYKIAGWDFDSIIATAERKVKEGKGITLVEQVALLQKSNVKIIEAQDGTNTAISALIDAMGGGKND